MKVYEGSENYVFISYAHENKTQVMGIAEYLYARGCRIWYDDGDTFDGERRETVARHLANCAAVLTFISPESVDSEKCCREITIAIECRKQIVPVFLDEPALVMEMETKLRIPLNQYIHRKDFHTEEAFCKRICQCELLDSCKEKSSVTISDSAVLARTAKTAAKRPTGRWKINLKSKLSVPRTKAALSACFVLVLLFFASAFGVWKFTTKASEVQTSAAEIQTTEEILTSEPGAIQTEAPTVVEEETFLPFDMTSFDYAYSDDMSDNAMYTAKEFAKIVNSENVREFLPLGTRIKMIPNSKEITDEFIEFELVAYKHFEQADGAGLAKTTWLAVNALNESKQMNSSFTNSGGWPESELRDWLNETLYPTLPEYWKELIVRIHVSSVAGHIPQEFVDRTDYLFIPSLGEVNSKYVNDSYYRYEIAAEAEERTFPTFSEGNSRVKYQNEAVAAWWLRSPWTGSDAAFAGVYSSGNSGISNATYSNGVVLGFCFGESRYAYSDDPADNSVYTAQEFAKIVKSEDIKNLLPLGTRIKMAPNSKEITDEFIEFELVAYKHFEQADGSGMAKTTWLAVDLLNEERTMNEEWTNAGGWRDSELRGWLNETLYPSLPSYWKNLMVQVAVSGTAGNKSQAIVTSADYLFLPAIGEMDAWHADYIVPCSGEISSDAEERTFIRFTDEDVTRVKKRQGVADKYWLRSPLVSSDATFYIIYSSGSSGNGNGGGASNSYGVCPGFCI